MESFCANIAASCQPETFLEKVATTEEAVFNKAINDEYGGMHVFQAMMDRAAEEAENFNIGGEEESTSKVLKEKNSQKDNVCDKSSSVKRPLEDKEENCAKKCRTEDDSKVNQEDNVDKSSNRKKSFKPKKEEKTKKQKQSSKTSSSRKSVDKNIASFSIKDVPKDMLYLRKFILGVRENRKRVNYRV